MTDAIRHFENSNASFPSPGAVSLVSLMKSGGEMPTQAKGWTAELPAFALIDSNRDLVPRLAREGELVVRGVLGGALREAEQNPGETAVKAAAAIGVGAVLGAAATAASPVIAGTAFAIGIAGTASWMWSSLNTFDARNRQRNESVARALQDTWSSSDRASLNRNISLVERSVGKDALDLGLGLLSGATAGGASKFVPGLMCREMPSVGFKFFSQGAIAKAFPARMKEFEIIEGHQLPTKLDGAVKIGVKEILGYDASGQPRTAPEQTLVIGHTNAVRDAASLPKPNEIVATCRPDLLEPLTRAKSVLQHAADVEMQVDATARRLRFLTLEHQQASEAAHCFRPSSRYVLGDARDDLPVVDFIKLAQECKGWPQHIQEALKCHDLREIQTAFAHLPYRVSGLKGVGAESVVFELSPSNDAPIFAEGNVSPSEVVLKISKPAYGGWDAPYGSRSFDARLIGPLEEGKVFTDYRAYLQEVAEPIKLEDVAQDDFAALNREIKRHGYSFYDNQNDGQLGYTPDGRLVVIDWFAALHDRLCERPEELINDSDFEY